MNLLLVVLGGAVGAALRYLTDRAVQARHDTLFPWGTLTVNVVGSLVFGLLTGAVVTGAASGALQPLVGVGFCGALTTYSAFSFETLRLWEERSVAYAVAHVLTTVLAGLGAAFTGAALAHAIWPPGTG